MPIGIICLRLAYARIFVYLFYQIFIWYSKIYLCFQIGICYLFRFYRFSLQIGIDRFFLTDWHIITDSHLLADWHMPTNWQKAHQNIANLYGRSMAIDGNLQDNSLKDSPFKKELKGNDTTYFSFDCSL